MRFLGYGVFEVKVRQRQSMQQKKWFLFRNHFSKCRDDQTRTGDLAPPRRVRYQLRYIPILATNLD